MQKIDPNYMEFAEVDGMWIRSYTLEKANTIAAQHIHEHDHITLLASGTVRMWQNGEEVGEYVAPAIITVPAGKKHSFLAVTDNVVLCCLHNLRGTEFDTPQILSGVV